MVNIINTDTTLKDTYECYQGIINSVRKKIDKFKCIVEQQDKNLSYKMKQVLKLCNGNLKCIENLFKYIINNLVKSIKKIAFSYRK